ncbi:hypothetical protein AB0I55_11290 [Actinocatenispora sera]|uniref:Uncharacterized protein n=1 Tax=Actinocatenispora sera TaxID=390989 RepID=A0A810KYM7_9ACTN|nr:hypothetical protein [Actinocatenispora sera]BCJ27128.1 hypothetical protein Asera_12360 [Actinocatenispora sera]
MYGWIWRKLPFGLPGKLIGTLVLVAGAAALLWYLVFPAVDPILPFNDVQVTGPGNDPGSGNGAGHDRGTPSPTPRHAGGSDLPGN